LPVGSGGRLEGDLQAVEDDLALHRPVEVEALAHRAGGGQDIVGGEVELHGRAV